MKVKAIECKVKVNRIRHMSEMFEMLDSIESKMEDAWIYVSPGVVELMSAEASTVSTRKGIYQYFFGGKIINLNLGTGRIPTIKRWNQISFIRAKRVKYNLGEDCAHLFFFETK